MNKNILKIDLITLGINISLLILLRLSNIFFHRPQIISIVFGLLALGTIYISLYFCYKSGIEKVTRGNIFVLLGCAVANIVIYYLPFLGLLGQKGINGIMNFTFLLMYLGRIWIYNSFIHRGIFGNDGQRLGEKPESFSQRMLKIKKRGFSFVRGNWLKNLLEEERSYSDPLSKSEFGWVLIIFFSIVLSVGMFVNVPDYYYVIAEDLFGI